jgi:peptidoglycan/xylan/chitin deacetylase (PgdA/CDA1 family)
MQHRSYGPYAYTPIDERPFFRWPDDHRLALWVIPNIEFFHLRDPMPGVVNERIAPSHAKIPNVRNWSIRDYGNRVGVFRFMEVFARHGIRATVSLNSDICIYHPQIIKRALDLDWEFMGHGQSNALRQNEMPPDKEREEIKATLDRIQEATGKRPKGWLGAGIAETWNTLDILLEQGVEYVADWASDDLPFRMDIDGKTLFSIPYSLQVNDTSQHFNNKVGPEEFGRIITRTFDCLYRESATAPRVMAIALHPFVSGVPYWIDAIDDALGYICRHPGVWKATGSEIVEHYARTVPRG